MEWEPAASERSESWRVQSRLSATVPRTVEPSRKLTLPVATPADGATVAVNVTEAPRFGIRVEAVRLVLVETGVPMVTSCGVEEALASALSPA